MNTPICAFDAKIGILCPKCDAKVKGGSISKIDVDASMKLVKLAEKHSELDEIDLLRAFEVDGDYVLVLKTGDPLSLRTNSSLGKLVESEFDRKVWMIEGDGTDRRVLEDLFFPLKLLTVNIVWLPDGSKLTRVIISGKRTDNSHVDLGQSKRIMKDVRGMDLIVEFEKKE